MESHAFKFGLGLAALALLTFMSFEGQNIGKHLGLVEKDPVLVFVIPGVDSARRVRKAINSERIVWQGGSGLALRGGRVIALDLDAAGDVIEEAGWIDRPIQIVQLLARDDDEAGSEGSAGSVENRLERLRDLVNKPTLTRGEQLFVLRAMNDGIEI